MSFKTENISTVAAIVAAIAAIVAATVPAVYAYTSRNRELNIELVKIGVAILRADPKEEQTQGAREWAIKLIENNSGLKFSPEAKLQLIQYKLSIDPGYTDYGPSRGFNFGFRGTGPGGQTPVYPSPKSPE